MDKLTIYITFIIFIKVCFVILAVSHLYLKIKHKGGSKTDKTIVFWKVYPPAQSKLMAFREL